MDGSAAVEVPVALEGVAGPAILTTVRVTPAARPEPGTAAAACLEGRHRGLTPRGPSVERIGVGSESVTFRDFSDRGVFGCDNSQGPREENRRWCGGPYGVLYSGRLRDPRLSIGCRALDGTPLGFVWIEPEPEAAYVVVQQPGYAVAYEVASELPVRVSTASGVDIEGARASLDVREHAADGSLLRAYPLDAVVAG